MSLESHTEIGQINRRDTLPQEGRGLLIYVLGILQERRSSPYSRLPFSRNLQNLCYWSGLNIYLDAGAECLKSGMTSIILAPYSYLYRF